MTSANLVEEVERSESSKFNLAEGVPVIDFAPIRHLKDDEFTKDNEVVQLIHSACSDWGFFHIVNHPIDDDLLERYYHAKDVFFRLEKSEKDEVRRTQENSKGWLKKNLANKIFGYLARCEEIIYTTTLINQKNSSTKILILY